MGLRNESSSNEEFFFFCPFGDLPLHAPVVVSKIGDDVPDRSAEAPLDHFVPSTAAAVQLRVELFRKPAQRQVFGRGDIPVALRLPVLSQVLLPCRQDDEDAVAEVAAAVGERPQRVCLEGRQEHDEVPGRVGPGRFPLLQKRQRDVRLLHLCHGQFVGQVAVLRLQGFDGARGLLLRCGREVRSYARGCRRGLSRSSRS